MQNFSVIRSAALVRRLVFPVLLAAVLSGCSDVTSDYDDLNAARAARLFEKGWLPDILPASTYDLKVATTVDISAGRGRFRFDPKDYPAFTARLSAFDGSLPMVDSDNDSVRRLLERNYEAHGFAEHGSKWIFLCDQKDAICEFFVWQPPKSA